MNTPAHLIFGAAAFGKPGNRRVTTAAILGALVPDLSLYLMVGWSLLVMKTPEHVVFGELYFSDGWQAVFAVDNSFPLWGCVLAVGLWRRWPVLIAFSGAALLHLAFDFPLHFDDARKQFWPLSDWVFHSPLSYYSRDHYGQIIGPVEIGLCLILCGLMWFQYKSWWGRGIIVLAALAEAAPGILFAIMFSGGPPH